MLLFVCELPFVCFVCGFVCVFAEFVFSFGSGRIGGGGGGMWDLALRETFFRTRNL